MHKVNIQWQGDFKFAASNGRGHTVMLDTPVSAGGDDTGPSPMELILMSVAGCSGVDVVAILNKMQVRVDTFNVKVESTRAEDHPKIFTDIKVIYQLAGANIPPAKVARAVELSVDRYCSAIQIVNKTARMDFVCLINGVEHQL